MPRLRLITTRMDDALLDTALSTALLQRVATGELGPTLRLFTPGRIVAFGSQDTVNAGYLDAVVEARRAGFDAVERLAGGKAAVFHEETIAFAWATPHADSKTDIEHRFEAISGIVVAALARIGVAAAVGETPGEYCPGRFSVSVAGKKVMGVGQRLVRGAAHVGGVVVAGSADLVNAALIPTYAALGYEWRPETTGAVGIEPSSLIDALIAAFEAAGHTVEEWVPPDDLVVHARDLAPRHRPPIA